LMTRQLTSFNKKEFIDILWKKEKITTKRLSFNAIVHFEEKEGQE